VTDEENVVLVRRAFELLDEGGFEAVLEHYHELLTEDCRWGLAIAREVEGQTYTGPEGLRRYQGDFDATFESVTYGDLRFRAVGDDQVLVRGRLTLRGRGSGVPVSQDVGWLARFDGDRICQVQSFLSPDEAMAAAEAHA
jgi:ketosteroid isomerase-like protein